MHKSSPWKLGPGVEFNTHSVPVFPSCSKRPESSGSTACGKMLLTCGLARPGELDVSSGDTEVERVCLRVKVFILQNGRSATFWGVKLPA